MDRAKKGLMISSLVSLSITCVLLILAVFKIKVFEGVLLHILLIFSTLTLASAFMINELNVIKRDKVLGSVSSALLLLSVLFAFIIFCSPLLENGGYFCTATAIISIFSIFFMIIISIKTKLNKRFFAIQIHCQLLQSELPLTENPFQTIHGNKEQILQEVKGNGRTENTAATCRHKPSACTSHR